MGWHAIRCGKSNVNSEVSGGGRGVGEIAGCEHVLLKLAQPDAPYDTPEVKVTTASTVPMDPASATSGQVRVGLGADGRLHARPLLIVCCPSAR